MEKALHFLAEKGVLNNVTSKKIDICKHCTLGKQTRVKFVIIVHRTEGSIISTHVYEVLKRHLWMVNTTLFHLLLAL